MCDFSELCQFCCSAGVLPALCVYTHWHRGRTEKGQTSEYSKIFWKKTIFNEFPVNNKYEYKTRLTSFPSFWLLSICFWAISERRRNLNKNDIPPWKFRHDVSKYCSVTGGVARLTGYQSCGKRDYTENHERGRL